MKGKEHNFGIVEGKIPTCEDPKKAMAIGRMERRPSGSDVRVLQKKMVG